MVVLTRTCISARNVETQCACIAEIPQDDVEHTFIDCDRWWNPRRDLEVELNSAITTEKLMEATMQSKTKWNAVIKFITSVLSRKEADERAIQAAEN